MLDQQEAEAKKNEPKEEKKEEEGEKAAEDGEGAEDEQASVASMKEDVKRKRPPIDK